MVRLLTPSHAVENVDPVSGCQPSAARVPRLSTHRAPSVATAFSAPLSWTPPAPPLNLGTRVLKWWEDGVVTLGPACLRRGSTQETCFLASGGSIFLQRKTGCCVCFPQLKRGCISCVIDLLFLCTDRGMCCWTPLSRSQ